MSEEREGRGEEKEDNQPKIIVLNKVLFPIERKDIEEEIDDDVITPTSTPLKDIWDKSKRKMSLLNRIRRKSKKSSETDSDKSSDWKNELKKKTLKTKSITHPVPKRKSNTNYIRTTKYTLLSFLPFCIFQQLFKVSNLYFVAVMCFNLIPGVSPIFPLTSIMPVIYIFGATLIKEAIEDIARLRADLKANGKTIEVYDTQLKEFVPRKTAHVMQGDIIRLTENNEVPCDMLILYTPKKESSCYITTANLDGETNLKKRQGVYISSSSSKEENEKKKKQKQKQKKKRKKKEEELMIKKILSRKYICEMEENTENLDQMKGKIEYEDFEIIKQKQKKQKKEIEEEFEMNEYEIGSLEEWKKEKNKGKEEEEEEQPIIFQILNEKYKNIINKKNNNNSSSSSSSQKSEEEEELEEGGEELELKEEIITIKEESSSSSEEEKKKNATSSILKIKNSTTIEKKYSIFETHQFTINNILLRGVYLKITPYVIGLSTYTGKRTKLFLNLKKSKTKWGILDRKMNVHIFSLLLFQQILVICGVILSYYSQKSVAQNSWYLQEIPTVETTNWYFPFTEWMTILIVIEVFIPMSLFVTIQVIISAQAILMQYSIVHFDNKKEKKINMIVKTSNLNFDLAHMDIVFSDKTGTLTENKMEYEKCFIYDEIFKKKDNISNSIRKEIDLNLLNNKINSKKLKFSFRQHINKKKESLDLFLLNLILNNTVTPHHNNNNSKIKYDGPSSDEVALVSQCADPSEYIIKEKLNDKIICKIRGNLKTFKILDIIPFNSKRKRSSIIVQQISEEQEETEQPIYLFCKGADNELLKRSSTKEKNSLKNKIMEKVNNFSYEGLRILVLGYKILSLTQFNEFHKKFNHAKNQIQNQSLKMEEIADEIERNLELLGTTAIADELQQGVPEAVSYLRNAGMQVWILTGDKTETAINIGYQSLVMERGVHAEIHLTSKSYEKNVFYLKNRLIRLIKYFKNPIKFLKKEKINNLEFGIPAKKYVIIVDNESLDDIMNSRRLKQLFIKLIKYCDSVLCCRVTPIQKAIVTGIVQKQLKKRGVAIGDGANDVSMIQKAYVGIGIMGNEGSQASRASDFAIPKFKYIIDLLAVQGRYCYIRSSDCVLISLYKNFMYAFTSYIYLFFNLFTGQILFDSWIYQTYNLVFHSIPPLLYGCFEKDLSEKIIKKSPSLYPSLQIKDPYFNRKRLGYWYLVSIYQSMVNFFSVYFVVTKSNLLGEYKSTEDIFMYGHVVMTGMMITMYLTYAIHSKSWTYLHIPVFALSFFLYCIWVTFDSSFRQFLWITDFYYISTIVYDKIFFYILLLFNVTASVLPIFIIKYIWQKFFPSNAQKVLSLGRKKWNTMYDNEIREVVKSRKQRNIEERKSRKLRKIQRKKKKNLLKKNNNNENQEQENKKIEEVVV